MSEPTKAIAVFQDAYTSKSGIPFLAKIANQYGTFAVFRAIDNPADGELWADATNIYTQTGLTPTELADQRAQLKRALQMLMDVMPADAPAKGQLVGIEERYSDAISFANSVLRNSNYKAH